MLESALLAAGARLPIGLSLLMVLRRAPRRQARATAKVSRRAQRVRRRTLTATTSTSAAVTQSP
jgi:hypothetical protein